MNASYRLSAATGLHKGDREYQQDRVELLAHTRANGCVMGVVADGMGGRTGGRKAADQVMLTARQLFDRYAPDQEDAGALLHQIGIESHMVIKLTALSAEEEPHSTMAAFLIKPGGECNWVHTGDSRLYHFRGSTLVRRTKDQSYVQALIDQGELTEEKAIAHPQGNVLLCCLGTDDTPRLEAHYIPRLQIGDSLLACSDGIWPYFTPEELGTVLHSQPPREASQFLVEKARARAMGGGDNLSLAIVKVEPLEPGKTAIGSAFSPLR
ncbi:MAG: protein phosphatase 2C domain-containing protein [Desulfovibrionaceae bacterium]|jgi:serine/threonine protein phosphatase PrpC|nr:protein phosphatase 2C domain-containing protein [Desulfovibrionaceae bacterium]